MSAPRTPLPEGLADMPPGPGLAAVLDGIDPAGLPAVDCAVVVKAWNRQASYVQARFGEAMVWLGLCRPGPDDRPAHYADPPEDASDQVRALLRWTRRFADTQYYLAIELQRRVPAVHQAMLEGRIDPARARVLADGTRPLSEEQARRVCDLLLGEAMGLTTGQLGDRVRQLVIAIDPDAAARKEHQGRQDRRVVGYANPDGTGTVTGTGLPVDEATAACRYLDHLARRIKQAGDCSPIDHIRADVFAAMLSGTFLGWSEQQIIAHFTTRRATQEAAANAEGSSANVEHSAADAEQAAHGRGAGECSAGGCDGRTAPEHTDGGGHPTKPTESGSAAACGAGGGSRQAAGSETQVAGAGSAGELARSANGTTGDGTTGDGTTGDGTIGPRRQNPRQGIELRVRLSTLLGLDRFPAEVAGWGHTHAGNARRIVAAHTGATWRYAVCDDHGALLFAGLITGRPAGRLPRSPVRGGVIEVGIRLSLLEELHDHPDRFPAWARIIDQIATDLHACSGGDGDQVGGPPAPPGGPPDDPPGDRSGDREGGDQPDASAGGGDAVTPGSAERDRRFPTASMRRRVQTRDRQCVFVGCRMPAADTDTDHVRRWTDLGPTQDHNLVSLCRHDHRLKDRHGWRLHHTAEGTLQWTSPTGLTHTVTRPPIMIALPHMRGRPATTLDPAVLDPAVLDPGPGPGPDPRPGPGPGTDRDHGHGDHHDDGHGNGDGDPTWCSDQPAEDRCPRNSITDRAAASATPYRWDLPAPLGPTEDERPPF